jgi:hypothetical protein
MKFPTHATMNTYAASAGFCAYADRICNRLCTPEARPVVLLTCTDSVIIPEHLLRLEKGGDTTIHSQLTKKIQAVFKTQPSKEGSQETQSKDYSLIARQEIQTAMKDLRN